jgi:hypothetical protein
MLANTGPFCNGDITGFAILDPAIFRRITGKIFFARVIAVVVWYNFSNLNLILDRFCKE